MSHVIVVGAGVAGLTCAWSLVRAGHEVEVLEADGVPGGRVRSERLDGFAFERGARWFGDDPAAHELLRRLSLSDAVAPLPDRAEVLGPTGLVAAEPGAALLPGEPLGAQSRFTLIEGGLGRLPRALAEPVTVRLGWSVLAVRSDPLGVRVEYIAPSGERVLRAEAAVLALPLALARTLTPELPAPKRAVPVPRERFGLVHLGTADALPEGDVRVPGASGLDLAGWSVTRCVEGSALRVALRSEVAERFWSAPDAAWVDHVTGQLERTPVGKLEPVVSLVDRFLDHGVEAEGAVWSGRIGATGATGSVAGAIRSGLAAAARAVRAAGLRETA